jgi:hypothetical protein
LIDSLIEIDPSIDYFSVIFEIADSDKVIWGYEPQKSRMSSSGWCGSKDAFIFLSVDLQRIYTLTTLRQIKYKNSFH